MPPAVPATPRRSAPTLLGGLAATGTLTWMAFNQGGYFEDVRLTGAVVLWAALAMLCATELRRLRLSSPALAALAALALLTAWTALSTTWTSDAVRGERLVDLDLLYVALFAIGLITVGSGRHARVLLFAALAVCGVVMAAAVWARLHPGAFGSPPAELPPPGYRMDWPFGYWNAVGGIGAMGGVLALGFAGDPRSPLAVRSVSAAVSVLCLVATYLTFSRGSIAALAAGIVVLFAIGGHRATLVASVAVVGVATAALVLRLEAIPALSTDPLADEGQRAAGKAFTPVLITTMCLAAGAQAVLAVGTRSVALSDLVRRAGRPLLVLAAGSLAIVVIGAYVVRADAIEGRAASVLLDTESWLDRNWDEFNRPGQPAPTESGSARLDSARGTRSDLFDVALDGFKDDPFRGHGAGSYQVLFFRHREVSENVQNTHSLPLETMAELGLVGTGLLLTFLGAIGAALVRSRRRRLALPTTQTAAAAAAVTVWLVHTSVDWDWQMPAFTGVALLVAATLFPAGRRMRRRTSHTT